MQCTHGLIFTFGAMIQLAVFLFPLIVLQLEPTLNIQGQIKSTVLPSDICFTSCPVQDHDVLQQITTVNLGIMILNTHGGSCIQVILSGMVQGVRVKVVAAALLHGSLWI